MEDLMFVGKPLTEMRKSRAHITEPRATPEPTEEQDESLLLAHTKWERFVKKRFAKNSSATLSKPLKALKVRSL